MGGGYVVNNTDWASYNPTYGVGALGTTGFAGYSPAVHQQCRAGRQRVDGLRHGDQSQHTETINSLRITAATAINFNPGQTLTISSGGLLLSNALTLGSAPNNGSLTTTGSELFIYANTAASTINSAITGSGVALVKGGTNTLTLAGTNTYTGGTYHNAGTLTLASTGTLGTGGIFIQSGTFTQAAGGIIPSQALTIYGASGGSAAGLAGNNSLTSVTFNNNGGATGSTLTTGGVLTLTANGAEITASSSNVGSTAAISSGTIDFANAANPVITVNPISFNGQNIAPLQATLSIAAVIQDSSNPISRHHGRRQSAAQRREHFHRRNHACRGERISRSPGEQHEQHRRHADQRTARHRHAHDRRRQHALCDGFPRLRDQRGRRDRQFLL